MRGLCQHGTVSPCCVFKRELIWRKIIWTLCLLKKIKAQVLGINLPFTNSILQKPEASFQLFLWLSILNPNSLWVMQTVLCDALFSDPQLSQHQSCLRGTTVLKEPGMPQRETWETWPGLHKWPFRCFWFCLHDPFLGNQKFSSKSGSYFFSWYLSCLVFSVPLRALFWCFSLFLEIISTVQIFVLSHSVTLSSEISVIRLLDYLVLYSRFWVLCSVFVSLFSFLFWFHFGQFLLT